MSVKIFEENGGGKKINGREENGDGQGEGIGMRVGLRVREGEDYNWGSGWLKNYIENEDCGWDDRYYKNRFCEFGLMMGWVRGYIADRRCPPFGVPGPRTLRSTRLGARVARGMGTVVKHPAQWRTQSPPYPPPSPGWGHEISGVKGEVANPPPSRLESGGGVPSPGWGHEPIGVRGGGGASTQLE